MWVSASKMLRDRMPCFTEVTQYWLSHLARSVSDAVFYTVGSGGPSATAAPKACIWTISWSTISHVQTAAKLHWQYVTVSTWESKTSEIISNYSTTIYIQSAYVTLMLHICSFLSFLHTFAAFSNLLCVFWSFDRSVSDLHWQLLPWLCQRLWSTCGDVFMMDTHQEDVGLRGVGGWYFTSLCSSLFKWRRSRRRMGIIIWERIKLTEAGVGNGANVWEAPLRGSLVLI